MLINQAYTRFTFISLIIVGVLFIIGCQSSARQAHSLSNSQSNQSVGGAVSKNIASSPIKIIAGTYNQKGSEGIYGFSYDSSTSELSAPKLLAKTDNPSYIHIESNKIYVANEVGDGRISTYTLPNNDSLLEPIASTATNGAFPCYVSMSPDKQFLATANYMGGNISIFRLDAAGLPLADPQILQHTGKGANKSRQEAAHAHWVQWDEAQNHIYAVDLGIDEVRVYPFDSVTGKAGEGKTALKLSPGNGPRHLYFHPSKPFAYILNELSNTITLAKKGKGGVLTPLQTFEMLPSAFTGHNQGGHIYITLDGKTLYASNRGHNSIVVFSIADDGFLNLLDTESTRGNWPRHFLVLEDVGVMLVANQESNNIVVLSIHTDGTLSATSEEVSLPQTTFLGRL